MKVIASHYAGDCSWIPDYTDDYILYDRSDSGLLHRIEVPNVGNADYDKLTYLVDNYDDLPDQFLLTKSNIFKYISREEFDAVKYNTSFTPLLTQHHKVYEPVCRYTNGIYEEVNNSWYLGSVPAKYFKSYNEFANAFGLPTPEYLQFAPGGNYIVTRERVHRYPRYFYEDLRLLLPYTQLPGEAQFIERTYYTLWK